MLILQWKRVPQNASNLHIFKPCWQEVALQCIRNEEGEQAGVANEIHQKRICNLEGMIFACVAIYRRID